LFAIECLDLPALKVKVRSQTQKVTRPYVFNFQNHFGSQANAAYPEKVAHPMEKVSRFALVFSIRRDRIGRVTIQFSETC
jgi:hypothetical protein